jgi:hypothetical protein
MGKKAFDKIVGGLTLALVRKRKAVRRGSGNVFADLGLPNPEQAQLALQIYKIVKARGLTLRRPASFN